MSWTQPEDLRAQVTKLWDSGALLESVATGEALFPRRLSLKGPSSSELASRFDESRQWIAALRGLPRCRVTMREVRHRLLGDNLVPSEVWVDSLDDALALIGKSREAARFERLLQAISEALPPARAWVEKNSLQALALEPSWPRILRVVSWVRQHPRPGLYLREIDAEGVDTKFIEAHRAVLAALMDLALPEEAIDARFSRRDFERRYGFREKPLRVRFRALDPASAILPGRCDQDLTVTQAAFAALQPRFNRIFITENEINFLSFPTLRDSAVVFGGGYGFDMLEGVAWLSAREIYYWGDIDTHGFAILDQLRFRAPEARAFLMDRATLMAHEAHWGDEPKPAGRDLTRLRPEELDLYNDLRDNRIRPGLRLEQEPVRFGWLIDALEAL